MTHAFTVDVEDWFQVWALSEHISMDSWDRRELRVEAQTEKLLCSLERFNAKGTFFVLGWIAERCPSLIRQISDAGHEVASHGWDHIKAHQMTASQFSADITRTKSQLEDLIGREIIGYRAPGFSIDENTPFAYEELVRAGYKYSSSSHPIAHDHYGDKDALRVPHHAFDEFIEIPVATIEVCGRRIPCGGGGWFRALPYMLTKHFWSRLDQDSFRGVFYCHPWELDDAQPRISGLSLKTKMRHYMNLDKTHDRIGQLLSDFSWSRIDQVFSAEIYPSALKGAA